MSNDCALLDSTLNAASALSMMKDVMLRLSIVLFSLVCTATPAALAQSDAGRRRSEVAPSARGADRGGNTDAVVTGTARLRGRLFAADTSQPVRFADLRVTSNPPGVSLRVSTDGAGLFDVPGLPAGVYTLVATKPGFVALQFGQRRPFEPGTPVELAAGETRELEFALPRGSVITGRVTDETGDPVPHAVVSASRYVYGVGGRRRLENAEADDTTDDRGQFRIFGLMPGAYVVSASEGSAARGRSRGEGAVAEGYAKTYYPGVAIAADAATVVVGLGQEANANFGLVAARLSAVSGVVTDSLGRPAAATTVVLTSGDGDDDGAAVSAQTRQDGSFRLAGVPPGNHLLSVRRDAGAAGHTEMARVPVAVPAGTDITDLAVSTGRGATIEGILMVRAGSSGERRGLMVAARSTASDNGRAEDGVQAAAVDANGRFRLDGVFGEFMLELRGAAAPGWTIESVAIDGRDATDRAASASSARTLTARVVVSDRVTDVVGTASDARGMPRTDFVAVFLPASLGDDRLPTRYVRTARAGGDGRVRVQGLPSGTYVVVGLESLEEGREWDPAFQAWARQHGTVARLEGGQQMVVNLQF